MDVSEMINVIILAGRGYSVKLLTWFKYYCEVMPLFIMLFHIACMVTFASHEKEVTWDMQTWINAMTGLGLATEEKPYYNDYALYVAMNQVVSDHGCTIAKILGKEDVKDIDTEHRGCNLNCVKACS